MTATQKQLLGQNKWPVPLVGYQLALRYQSLGYAAHTVLRHLPPRAIVMGNRGWGLVDAGQEGRKV